MLLQDRPESSVSTQAAEELFQELLGEPGSEPLPGPQGNRKRGRAIHSRAKPASKRSPSKASASRASGSASSPSTTSQPQAGKNGAVLPKAASEETSNAVANLLSSSALSAEARDSLLEQIRVKRQQHKADGRNQFATRNSSGKEHAGLSQRRKPSSEQSRNQAGGSQRSNTGPGSRQDQDKPKGARLAASKSQAPSAARSSRPAQRPQHQAGSLHANLPQSSSFARSSQDPGEQISERAASPRRVRAQPPTSSSSRRKASAFPTPEQTLNLGRADTSSKAQPAQHPAKESTQSSADPSNIGQTKAPGSSAFSDASAATTAQSCFAETTPSQKQHQHWKWCFSC